MATLIFKTWRKQESVHATWTRSLTTPSVYLAHECSKVKSKNNLYEVYIPHGNVNNLQAAEGEIRRLNERPLFTKILTNRVARSRRKPTKPA